MNKHELIEKYFSNGLSDQEFKQLEQLLEQNEPLREEFYKELEIKQHISQEKHRTLKHRFQELDAENKLPRGIKPFGGANKKAKKVRWLPYAAAVALLVGIGSFIYSLQPNYQDLYAENFEVYPNVISLTTRSETSHNTSEEAAFKLYESGAYHKAEKAFHQAYERAPKDYLLFYKGVSLLAQNQTEEGIRVLQGYDWEQQQSDFTDASNWYLGLAHLQENQPEKTKLYLQKVVNSDSNLSKQAQQLLQALD